MGEDEFKLRCVKSSGDENDISKAMMDAYTSLKAEGFSPEWLTSKDCMKVKRKERNCVYLFDPFQGQAFDHIKSLGCRILGPQCILESLEYKLEIPRRARPVYNLAMRNVVACCTNLDKQTRDSVHEKVELMSGSIYKDFTDDVTHLIAGEVGSKKYQVAASLGKPIMSADWVSEVWEISQARSVHGTDSSMQEYRCPIFKGLVVTVSGLDPEERNEVKKLIHTDGGKYSGEMKVNECTHLIINKPKGVKYDFAKKWKLHIVKIEWLYDSIEKGFCQDTAKYRLEPENDRSQAKTSTPEKDIPRTRASTIANLSCISNVSVINHINETSAPTNNTHKSFEETDTTLNGIDLTQPPGDLFLDGCKVYLSGFRGQALEKVRKVINAGGGTRLNQLNENVSHVIVGERVDRDMDLLKAATFRPHVVSAVWLAECYRQGHTVDEQPYLCAEFATDISPSPKSKGKSTVTDAAGASKEVSTAAVEEGQGDPDMDDIMSQYLLQGGQGANSQDETVLDGNLQDPDQTQDPNLPQVVGTGQNTNGDLPQATRQQEHVIGGQGTDTNNDLPEAAGTGGPGANSNRDLPEAADTGQQDHVSGGQDIKQAELTAETDIEGLPTPIFHGKTFMFFGIDEESAKEFTPVIVDRQGRVLDAVSRVVPDYAVVPLLGFPVDRTVSEVVTNAWLQMCWEHDELLTDDNELYRPLDLVVDERQLSGCVLSVSGYSATEKDCLMHIAEVMGATCQDYFLAKAKKGLQPTTHLIIREAEGSKYNAAKKFNIPAVSKKWLFACAKTGKREKEDQFHIDNEQQASREKDVAQTEAMGRKESPVMAETKADSAKESSGRNEHFTKEDFAAKEAVSSKNNTSAEESQSKKSLKRSSSALDCNDASDDRPGKVARQIEEDKQTDTRTTQDSQKENQDKANKGVNNRVKALQADTTPQSSRYRTGLQTPSPGRFLNPNKSFHPVFDLTDAMNMLETPEGQKKASRRKSSLPLEDFYTRQIEEAVKISETAQPVVDSPQKGGASPENEIPPLHGVIIAVNKKLLSQQAEFNNTVAQLGGDYRWSYDSSCTHYLFQGRANDTTKEFRLARDQGKLVVSPYWLHMCKEQKARVDESLFPHTFNPNLSLSVVCSKRLDTPGRSSRRSVRGVTRRGGEDGSGFDVVKQDAEDRNKASKSSTSECTSTPSRHSPKHAQESAEEDKVTTGPSDDDPAEKEGHITTEIGGTLELREVLSKQLEKMMDSKSKKNPKKRSKRLNSSGQLNTSGETSRDLSGEGRSSNHSRPPSRQNRWSLQDDQQGQRRNSRQDTKAKLQENPSQPEPSQSVQITWDDPTGRLEEEKLAHKLERVCSPDPSLPLGYLDTEFSEMEEDPPVPHLPHYGKGPESHKEDERIKTPEPPTLAFPKPRHSIRPDPSERLTAVEYKEPDREEEETKKSPPVFLLSGISQEERDDYGALVEQLGGRMLDGQMYSATCTHLVIGVPSRNEKFLASVASGKWVLHKSYFEACRQEHAFVPEAFYEWGGEGTSSLVSGKNHQVMKLAAAAHSWRVIVEEERKRAGSCLGAFGGWKVLLCADPNKEASFRRLLVAGGATVLANKPPFTSHLSATHAFVEMSKYKMSQEDLEELLQCNVLCLRPDFIAAHLTDSPPPNPRDFCPPEISALELKASVNGETSGRRKLSSASAANDSRSKRTKKH